MYKNLLVDNPEENQEYSKGRCGGNIGRIFGSIKRTLLYHLGIYSVDKSVYSNRNFH